MSESFMMLQGVEPTPKKRRTQRAPMKLKRRAFQALIGALAMSIAFLIQRVKLPPITRSTVRETESPEPPGSREDQGRWRDPSAAESLVIMADGGHQMNDRSQDREGGENMDQIHLISQQTRGNLIQNILGHPCMMPSLKELSYYNPRKTGTVSGHIEKLVDAGIVMRVTLPQGERRRDLPSTFFTMSDHGYELLDQHNIFLPALVKIREDHARVEKTAEIEKYENAPRPTVDVEYPHPLKGDGEEIVDPRNEDEDRCDWDDVSDSGKIEAVNSI